MVRMNRLVTNLKLQLHSCSQQSVGLLSSINDINKACFLMSDNTQNDTIIQKSMWVTNWQAVCGPVSQVQHP